jgi:hypothetical protein
MTLRRAGWPLAERPNGRPLSGRTREGLSRSFFRTPACSVAASYPHPFSRLAASHAPSVSWPTPRLDPLRLEAPMLLGSLGDPKEGAPANPVPVGAPSPPSRSCFKP